MPNFSPKFNIVALISVLVSAPALAQQGGEIYDPLDRNAFSGSDSESLSSPSGLDVRQLLTVERQLAAQGYDPGRVDGNIDRQARSAIRAFQEDAGMRPTGEPSPELYRQLRLTALTPGELGTDMAANEEQLNIWARQLIGTPVYGEGTNQIGQVEDLVVGADRRVRAVVVSVEGLGGLNRALVPVPWEWVDHQIGRPTIILPWSAQDVAWLVANEGDQATASAGVGGWKTSWLDGADARLEDGSVFGQVKGFIFAPDGHVRSVVVRRQDGGPFYDIPRDRMRVSQRQVVIEMPREDVLALQPRRTGEPAPSLRDLAETPDRQASPEREAWEQAAERELRVWENRTARIGAELGPNSTEAEALERAYRTAKQHYQALIQTADANWQTERHNLETAMDDLRDRWSDLAQALE